MSTLVASYFNSPLGKRLAISVTASVLVNAVYCLAYRYSAGDPATLFEAVAWGLINIAPWIAVIEIGRSVGTLSRMVQLFVYGCLVSLLIEAALYLEFPTLFDLTRRVPGAILSAIVLLVLRRFSNTTRSDETLRPDEADHLQVDWACSAGNYVELHKAGEHAKLMRSTLAAATADACSPLIRIHRRYSVNPDAVARIEHSHVLLHDGTRLPIGDRYRDHVNRCKVFVPSSQQA